MTVIPRVGTGVDVHAFGEEGTPLYVAGLHWPGERGLSGHSDGDVVAHAAADALFAASGTGDLGSNFGVDRPDMKGASGVRILSEAAAIVRAAGFEIQTSNNAPSPAANVFTVIAGSPVCGTFANQVLKTEAYRPTDRFADAVKGLHVYGATVTRPNAVGLAYVKFSA